MATKQVVPKTGFWERPAKYSPWTAGLIVPAGCATLYTPGMTARDENGESIHIGDAVGQARRILEQIESVVVSAGGTMDDIVHLTVFLADIEDAVPIQAVRNEYWPEDPPVSSTIQVDRIAGDMLVEIEAIAAIPAG